MKQGPVVEWLTRRSHTAKTPGSIPGGPIEVRSHSLVADFGAIVHRREPDNPVKDGALSRETNMVF